jgi:radical SAM superfamily enzyme YgiQ (UPF0313 family)/glycosyltransferase involved in cell wall biosynthesis
MFIWPGIYLGWGNLGKGFENSSINHGLSSISAVLKGKEYPCFCVDMRSFSGWDHFENIIKKQQFDVCLVGFYSVDTKTADTAIRMIKKYFPTKPIIVGGVHLTFNKIDSFSLADTVVWGEGDEVILDLLACYDRGEKLPSFISAPRIKDLDVLPSVDRTLFNSEFEKNNPFLPLLPKPFYTMNFSRGCNYKCRFCLESKNLLWKGQTLRSPEHCISELVSLRMGTKGEIGSLMIHDDNFPSQRAWVEKFIRMWEDNLPRIPWWCQMRGDAICRIADLIPALSKMGMTWCSIGIEGSQKMLDFYNKQETVKDIIDGCEILHKNQINIFGNYIMGSPTETPEDVAELSEILKKIKPEHHSSSTYTAYPGSFLYDYCIEHDLFVGDGSKDSDYYSLVRYPYERKIVGADYNYIRQKQHELSQDRGNLKVYSSPIEQKEIKKKEIPEVNKTSLLSYKVKAKVSIVLLSHNRPGFLSEAINSVLKQTMKEWELIIIDDCSTDPDVGAVLSQAVKDSRIRAFVSNYDVNNISLLWNKAINMSTGQYISLLDDDNRKEPTFCAEMSHYLDTHSKVDAVSCFNRLFHTGDSLHNKSKEIFDAPKRASKEKIRIRNYIDSGCLMFRREVIPMIGWFDERLGTQEDWDFVIRLMYETKGIGILQKPLAEYRWHGENRIYSSNSLGCDDHYTFITKEKKYGQQLSLLLFHQDSSKITLSQNNVLRGVKNALSKIPWLTFESKSVSQLSEITSMFDLVMIFMPFSMDLFHIAAIRNKGYKTITYQCEDPQALGINVERASFVDYVFTNDISAKEELEKIVGKGNCGFCPSVSVDDVDLVFRENVPKKYDVIFYGYAYSSRISFLSTLLPKLKKGTMAIVGGGWENKNMKAVCLGELSEQDSIRVMEESKIVVLLNRQNTDLGGKSFSTKPESVVRGYFECASGSLIMLDNGRNHHEFNGEVIFYSDATDLVKKINYYLSNEEERITIGRKAKTRALFDFTYQKRITNLLNGVRSMCYYHHVH